MYESMAIRGVPNVCEYTANLLEKDIVNSPYVYGMDVYRLASMLKRGFLFPENKSTIESKGIYSSYQQIWPDGHPYMYYGVPQMDVLQKQNPNLADMFLESNDHDRDLQLLLNQSVEAYAKNTAVESWLSRFGVLGIDYDDAMHLIMNYQKMRPGGIEYFVDEVHTHSLLVALASSGVVLDDLYDLSKQATEYTGALLYFGSSLPNSSLVRYGVETDMECLIFTPEVLRPNNIDAVRMSENDLELFKSLCTDNSPV